MPEALGPAKGELTRPPAGTYRHSVRSPLLLVSIPWVLTPGCAPPPVDEALGVTRLKLEAPWAVAPTAAAESWALTSADAAAASPLVAPRVGHVRRPAYVAPLPAAARAVVPAGTREVRTWLSSPTEPCAATALVRWAGRTQRAHLDAKAPARWHPMVLKSSPTQAPTVLRIDISQEDTCTSAAWIAMAEAQARAAEHPAHNVILIILDTLRRDHLDCAAASAALTPSLSRLCQRGVFFANAFSTSGWTYPAVASLLSGLLPHEHGAERRDRRHTDLRREVSLLPEILRWRGFTSAAVLANPYATRGLWRGFDYFSARHSGAGGLGHHDRAAAHVVDEALTWLRDESFEPFFLTLLFIDVHEPVDAAQDAARSLPACAGIEPLPLGWQGIDRPSDPPTTAEQTRMACRKALYGAALTVLDAELGRLLAGLGPKVSARTSLIVVADHGEELWDHAQAERTLGQERWGVDHGHTLYQELTQVPLLVVPPEGAATPPESRSNALVSITDVFATVLSLAGAGAAGHRRAYDLSTALSRPFGRGHAQVLSETTLYGPGRMAVTTPELRAVFTDPNEVVVFDRLADPRELAPLPAEAPLARRGAALLELVRLEGMHGDVQE